MEMTTITLRVTTDFRDKVKVCSRKLKKTMMQFIIDTVEASLWDYPLRKSEAPLPYPHHVREECRELNEEFRRTMDLMMECCQTITSPEFTTRINQLIIAEKGFIFLLGSNSWRSLDLDGKMRLLALARQYDIGTELKNSRPASSLNVVDYEVKNDDGNDNEEE
ncbi:MAG: hypothetical protein ACYDBP_14710 [Leptospirales bacterium]